MYNRTKTIHIGKDNSTFQQILALKENRKKRSQEKMFFVEGVQNIKDAIEFGWEIEALIYSNVIELSNWAESILHEANKNYVLDIKLMNRLSDKSNISELLAIIKMRDGSDYISYSSNPIFVLVDRPAKKGNFGTIVRSCDALNVEHIYYSGHGVDIYDPKTITASMGSFFKIPISFIASNSEFTDLVSRLKNKYKRLQVVATSLQTENRLQDYDFTLPVLLLVGNETNGLCKFYNDNADSFVKIPMREGIDSLNIACATTTCLYEINRQRDNILKVSAK